LIGLFIFGKTIKGQTNWYQFAGISLQPSEFAKIGTALLLAKYISDTQTTFQTLKEQVIDLGIIFLPVLFILLHPDAGSALFLVLNRERFPTWYLWTGAFLIVGFILALIIPPLYLSLLICLGFGVHFYFNKLISRNPFVYIFLLIASIAYTLSVEYVFENVLE